MGLLYSLAPEWEGRSESICQSDTTAGLPEISIDLNGVQVTPIN